jgi:arylsulfatase A-like enzyme
MKIFKTLLAIIIYSNSFNFISQEKPNVVMIVLDDLNDFIGAMKGHPQTQTPNIDKLASQSVLFDNAHSNVPVCSPSRASFMTGIHPISSGIWGFGNALEQETFINSKSIPEYLRENGYKVFQSGKVFHANPKKCLG